MFIVKTAALGPHRGDILAAVRQRPLHFVCRVASKRHQEAFNADLGKFLSNRNLVEEPDPAEEGSWGKIRLGA